MIFKSTNNVNSSAIKGMSLFQLWLRYTQRSREATCSSPKPLPKTGLLALMSLFFVLSSTLHAQYSTIEWARLIGGPGVEQSAMMVTAGGYTYMVGNTASKTLPVIFLKKGIFLLKAEVFNMRLMRTFMSALKMKNR